MIYFLDTEFYQSGTKVELISLGLVSLEGKTYYAQNGYMRYLDPYEYTGQCYSFLKENVYPQLDSRWRFPYEIEKDLEQFIEGSYNTIWVWNGNYDWVALCGTIFGDMMNVPKWFPRLPHNLAQHTYMKGIHRSELPNNNYRAHHALNDALWLKEVYEFLHQFPTLTLIPEGLGSLSKGSLVVGVDNGGEIVYDTYKEVERNFGTDSLSLLPDHFQ